MYIWEGKAVEDVIDLPRQRDPVQFRTGMLVGADEAQARVLLWFRDHSELAAFLHRIEPQRWGLAGAELVRYKDACADSCTRLDMLGTEEHLRLELNAQAEPHFRILWWGDLRELLFSQGEWPDRLRAEFFGGESGAIPQEQAPAFVDYLMERFRD